MTLSPSSLKWAATLLAASVSFIAYAQSKLPADLDPQSRARLPYLKKAELDAKGQKIFDTFGSKDGILTGPLARWLVPVGDAAALGEKIDEALSTDIEPQSAGILAKLDAPLIAAQYAALAD